MERIPHLLVMDRPHPLYPGPVPFGAQRAAQGLDSAQCRRIDPRTLLPCHGTRPEHQQEFTMLTWKTDGLITAEHNGYTYTINGPTPNDDSWGVEVDILNTTRAGADSFPFSDAFATLEEAMDYCERVAEEASRAEE